MSVYPFDTTRFYPATFAPDIKENYQQLQEIRIPLTPTDDRFFARLQTAEDRFRYLELIQLMAVCFSLLFYFIIRN
jgi:hypothetical protein